MKNIGRNINTNSLAATTTVTIDSTTAVIIAADNPSRIHLEVWLYPDVVDVDAFVRMYPAAADNVKHGAPLTRRLLGNDNLFHPCWKTPVDNPYTGEISAIALTGSFDLIVIEW